jgi:hypothetical protein
MSINHRLSTAYHPQTDGKTERQNKTMEQYLRAICNHEQDIWVELIPLPELGYNISLHTSIWMTPFWAVYHRHSEMQFKPPKVTSLQSETQAHVLLERQEETHRVFAENFLEAQEKLTKYASWREITFEMEDRVWLSTRHFPTNRPSKKLDYQRAGPYTVSQTRNKNAYKLDMPKMRRNHNVFHSSLFKRNTPPTTGQPSSEPHPVIVDDSDEWEVDQILDSKRRYGTLHYLVQQAGYSHIHTSWEPAANLENTWELVEEFH